MSGVKWVVTPFPYGGSWGSTHKHRQGGDDEVDREGQGEEIEMDESIVRRISKSGRL